MKITISIIIVFIGLTNASGQGNDFEWYSEYTYNGITIQNSYPKGGPYRGPTTNHHNYSYLVFFSRVVNHTQAPIKLDLHFSADSVAIPNSPNTYMKLFLPPDTMSMEKERMFSYGFGEIQSFDQSTKFNRLLHPNEDCLFYVVAIFYQTDKDAWRQYRGGNRAELVLKNDKLYYNMLPQVEQLICGRLIYQ